MSEQIARVGLGRVIAVLKVGRVPQHDLELENYACEPVRLNDMHYR